MFPLKESIKKFYNEHYSIPLELMEDPRVQEFLYWVNRGENPVELQYTRLMHDFVVDEGLTRHFVGGEKMIDIIDYITAAP